ncbi:TetR/AcrR family transcriptional regulator [Yoonia sp.]|uniref:TetR/AcrR family transcriptional regulator n=1 Tax=Yoonia sp. TaxID=2212373 RepID=UPI0025EBFFC5|nr:TetR/AcrR family transcriptional regulator [Yoonia sp.]
MRVFWAEGFDAASIDRLCQETRMPRASLYKNYGGKEGLFLATIAHYVKTCTGPVADALGPSGTLETDLLAFFKEVVALATRDPRTPGCLISCVLVDAAGANAAFRKELEHHFAALEDRIVLRLDHAPGLFPAADTRALAGMLAAVARGVMLRARSGVQAADLCGITNVAVDCAVRLRA